MKLEIPDAAVLEFRDFMDPARQHPFEMILESASSASAGHLEMVAKTRRGRLDGVMGCRSADAFRQALYMGILGAWAEDKAFQCHYRCLVVEGYRDYLEAIGAVDGMIAFRSLGQSLVEQCGTERTFYYRDEMFVLDLDGATHLRPASTMDELRLHYCDVRVDSLSPKSTTETRARSLVLSLVERAFADASESGATLSLDHRQTSLNSEWLVSKSEGC